MAYSPIEEGRLVRHRALKTVASRHDATPRQVALAWLLWQDGLIAIPKAGTPEHVRENRAALDLRLSKPDLVALDRGFPPPTGPTPLEVV